MRIFKGIKDKVSGVWNTCVDKVSDASTYLVVAGAALVVSEGAMAEAETAESIATKISGLWTSMVKFFTGAEGFLLAGLVVLVAGFGISLVRRVTSKA